MKKFYLILFLICIVCTACSTTQSPQIPYNDITFSEETNFSYLGSYRLGRINFGQKSPEYGEWTSIQFIFQSTVVCFGAFDKETPAVFKSASGYKWVEIKNQGRLCLELQKEQ